MQGGKFLKTRRADNSGKKKKHGRTQNAKSSTTL